MPLDINPNGLKFLKPELAVTLAPDIFKGLDVFTASYNGSAEAGAALSVPVGSNTLGRENPDNQNTGVATTYENVVSSYYDFPLELKVSDYLNGYGAESKTEELLIGLRNTLMNAAIKSIVQSSPTNVDDIENLNLDIDGGYKVLLGKTSFLKSVIPQGDNTKFKWQGDRLESGAFGWDVVQKIPTLISGLTAGAVGFARENAGVAWAVPFVPPSVLQKEVDLGFNSIRVVLTEKVLEASENVIVNARVIAGFKVRNAKVYNFQAI